MAGLELTMRVSVQGGRGGLALPGGGPTGNFARSTRVTEELLSAARSPKFLERARSLGFSDEAIEALSARVRSSKVGEILSGGWSDPEQILIGRFGLVTPTRQGRILHELGHVLDDVAHPGLFARSAEPGFGYSGFLKAERVAYAMQYGPGSVRGAVLAPFASVNQAHPVATKVVLGTIIAGEGYFIYRETR